MMNESRKQPQLYEREASHSRVQLYKFTSLPFVLTSLSTNFKYNMNPLQKPIKVNTLVRCIFNLNLHLYPEKVRVMFVTWFDLKIEDNSGLIPACLHAISVALDHITK